MPSFSDSIFIFVLALMLFGPKKLPQLARQLGRLMAEFRRASNEFRMQMEDELRVEEQKEHQKKVNELAGPPSSAPPLDDPPHPHLPPPASAEAATDAEPPPPPPPDRSFDAQRTIAEAGELRMMAPSTGLPASHRGSHTAAEEAAGETAIAPGPSVIPEHSILPPAVSSAGVSSDEPVAETSPHGSTQEEHSGSAQHA